MKKRLSEIAEIKAGHTFRGKADDPERTDGIRLVQIKDVKEKGIDVGSLGFAALNGSKPSSFLVEGDVLFPLKGARVEAAVFHGGGSVIATNQVAVIKANPEFVFPGYLAWYINSEEGGKNIAGLKVGSVVSSIGLKDLAGLIVPVPDKSAQLKVLSLYENWLARKALLEEMLVVGAELSEQACLRFLV